MNETLVEKIGAYLLSQSRRVTCAESCTGGGISYSFTSVAGSSQWFEGGYVTYSNEAKTRQLGVEEVLIASAGAVSEEVVEQMLAGALRHSGADCGIAVSGIAGPDGAVRGKPVGTVCIAWGGTSGAKTMTYLFAGNRARVREQAIQQSLLNLLQYLKSE